MYCLLIMGPIISDSLIRRLYFVVIIFHLCFIFYDPYTYCDHFLDAILGSDQINKKHGILSNYKCIRYYNFDNIKRLSFHSTSFWVSGCWWSPDLLGSQNYQQQKNFRKILQSFFVTPVTFIPHNFWHRTSSHKATYDMFKEIV